MSSETSAVEMEGKRIPLSLRTTPALREQLERAAKMNGRSLTQEVEMRLERSMDQDDLYVALVGDQSHAQNLVRAISTVIRRVEGLKEERYTTDWETLFLCRRAVNKVVLYMLGTDYSEEDYLKIVVSDEEARRRYFEMADFFAYDAIRDLGLGLPPAPGGKDRDMSRRLPLDPADEGLKSKG